MDFDEVVAQLRRRWWVIALAAAVAVVAVGAPALLRADRYEAVGTYLVRADVLDPGNLVRATATLVGGDEAMNTFASIARSGRIADAAAESAGTTMESVSVIARAVPGTNVLELGARAPDPGVATRMATAVGIQTRRYVRLQTRLFQLDTIDAPSTATRLRDGPDPLRIAGAALLGAALATAVVARVIASGRWIAPARPARVLDPGSGARTRRYLRRRVHEERVRHADDGRPFCVGYLAVVEPTMPGIHDPAPLDAGTLALVGGAISSVLRPHDVLAHVGDSAFAALLPITELTDARAMVDRWRAAVDGAAAGLLDASGYELRAGACIYDSTDWLGDPVAQSVVRDL